MSDTATILKFLEGYRAFSAGRREAQVSEISRFLHQFRSDLEGLRGRILREERRYAHRFNIFEALGIERKEEILHTQLMAHLLNPEASHGQGFLFLFNFFEVAQEHDEFVPPAIRLDKSAWRVRAEVTVEGGTLDLLIECAEPPYVLVIENKIDAGEQSKQLQRYGKWMQIYRRRYKRQLIFLTPEGHDSISSGNTPYIHMSYRQDITKFLQLSIGQVKARRVRDVLSQYLAVVKALTGDTDNERSMRQ